MEIRKPQRKTTEEDLHRMVQDPLLMRDKWKGRVAISIKELDKAIADPKTPKERIKQMKKMFAQQKKVLAQWEKKAKEYLKNKKK